MAATASSMTFSGRTAGPMSQVSRPLYTRGKEECEIMIMDDMTAGDSAMVYVEL